MVADHIAIQQVLNRYTVGACRSDWDMVLATFVEEGIWEAPGLGICVKGHDAIRASVSVFVDQMDYFIQINAPALITLAGDEAAACSAIREYGRFAQSGEAVEVFGLYDDVLVRTAAGWRFVKRTFTMSGINGSVPAA